MRDRFITWGTLDEQRRLMTFELDVDDAEIIRRVLPAADSSEELRQTVINAWMQRTTMPYPEGTVTERVAFASFGSIVPDGAEVEDKVRVASAEREWPFDLISAQLKRQFRGELEEFRERVDALEAFDENVYERLKAISDKISGELKEGTLRRHDFGKLQVLTDEMFGTMKRLRQGARKKRDAESKTVKRAFLEELAAAQTKLEEKQPLRKLFNELRGIQTRVKEASMAHSDRNALRKRLDELFKAVKSEMDASGETASGLSQRRAHLENRLKGLQGAISRMRYSVDRDNKDMFYEGRRRERANNQMAEQLAALKLTTIGDRAKSKASRLDDMLATQADLEKKLAKLIKAEEREKAKREEREAQRAKARAAAGASREGDATATGKKRRGRRAVHPSVLKSAAAGILAVAKATGEEAPEAPENSDAGKVFGEPEAATAPTQGERGGRKRGRKRGGRGERDRQGPQAAPKGGDMPAAATPKTNSPAPGAKRVAPKATLRKSLRKSLRGKRRP